MLSPFARVSTGGIYADSFRQPSCRGIPWFYADVLDLKINFLRNGEHFSLSLLLYVSHFETAVRHSILHLVDITAPRLGTASREDEVGCVQFSVGQFAQCLLFLLQPWAFESREFLRSLVVGKEVTFTSIHALPPGTDDIQRDLGSAEILLPASAPATSSSDGTQNDSPSAPVDLASELLRSGWVKTKESKRDATEEDLKKKELENEARTGSRGLWNPQGPKVCVYAKIHMCGGGSFYVPSGSASILHDA